MMVIIGKFAHAVNGTNSDPVGRWCRATTQLKRGRQLTIYSVYNVTKTDISRAGPSNIYYQQWKLLRLSGKIKPDARKQMVKDLQSEINTLQLSKMDYLCILVDLNETLGMDPDLMSSICVQNGLHDVLTNKYPHQHNTPTYHRGNIRLDYILLSNNVPTIMAM